MARLPPAPCCNGGMKWLLIAAAVVVAAGLFFTQTHSTKTAYLNGLPLYRDLPNRQFIFERDCYIFKLKAQDTDWPLVATHADRAGTARRGHRSRTSGPTCPGCESSASPTPGSASRSSPSGSKRPGGTSAHLLGDPVLCREETHQVCAAGCRRHHGPFARGPGEAPAILAWNLPSASLIRANGPGLRRPPSGGLADRRAAGRR